MEDIWHSMWTSTQLRKAEPATDCSFDSNRCTSMLIGGLSIWKMLVSIASMYWCVFLFQKSIIHRDQTPMTTKGHRRPPKATKGYQRPPKATKATKSHQRPHDKPRENINWVFWPFCSFATKSDKKRTRGTILQRLMTGKTTMNEEFVTSRKWASTCQKP